MSLLELCGAQVLLGLGLTTFLPDNLVEILVSLSQTTHGAALLTVSKTRL